MDEKVTVFEALVRYALSRYADEYDEVSSDCPYETRMGGDRAFLQEVSWFVYEWINPGTGTTILEEFVAEKVGNEERAARILLRKNVTYDRFTVVKDADTKGIITVRASDTGEEYRMVVPRPPERYTNGTEFLGRIHPRDGDTYMACGILTAPGEWDEGDDDRLTDEEYAEKFGFAIMPVKSARVFAQVMASTRSGPGRIEDIRTIAERSDRIAGVSEFADIVGLAPDVMHGVLARYKKEDKAFKDATLTEITAGINLRTVLMKYPKYFLKMVCLELDIGSLPSRGARVERICDRLPKMLCDQVYEMSPNEQRVLASILYKKAMQYPDCIRELSRLIVDDGHGENPNDPDVVDGTIHAYANHGLLIVGTGMLDGRIQKMVTVASEIKEGILKCPGWREYVSSNLASGTVKSRFTDTLSD